jgi:hypothetical protein
MGRGAYPDRTLTGIGYGGLDAEYRQMQAKHTYRASETRKPHVDDHHLRSCKAIIGYHIHATDGDIGHVRGILVDEETWAVRYIIVDTSNWWLGHQVLIAPQWIQAVSRSEEAVSVLLARQSIRDAPPYDASMRLDRKHEL